MTQQAKVNWIRVPLKADQLNDLNRIDNRKGFIQAGGHLGLTICTAALTIWVWATQPWLYVIPLLYIHGSVQGMLGAGVHELVHERVFSSRRMNRFFLAINSFLTGWNYPFFNISHKEHHRYTLNEPYDLEVTQGAQITLFNSQQIFAWKGIIPLIKNHWAFAFHEYQKNGQSKGIGSEQWMGFLFSRLGLTEKAAIRNWSRIWLAGHLMIIVAGVATGWWIVPVVISFGDKFGGFFGGLTHSPQHVGLLNNVNDFRLSCRTYTSNKLVEFLYWNMNYHIEHHMYAAVPCYNLPKLHKAIQTYLPPAHTLTSAWAEMLNIAFRNRQDGSYYYRPPLPEDQPGQEHLKLEHVPDESASDYLALRNNETSDDLSMDQNRKVWECQICAFVYDELFGLPEEGIAAGTKWQDIPDDWACPDCGVSKSDFQMVERSRVERTSPNSTSSKLISSHI